MKRPSENAPRWMHRLYAFVAGYFWRPCPICGRKFGGHEWAADLMTSLHSGVGVCPNCAGVARRRNHLFVKACRDDMPYTATLAGTKEQAPTDF